MGITKIGLSCSMRGLWGKVEIFLPIMVAANEKLCSCPAPILPGKPLFYCHHAASMFTPSSHSFSGIFLSLVSPLSCSPSLWGSFFYPALGLHVWPSGHVTEQRALELCMCQAVSAYENLCDFLGIKKKNLVYKKKNNALKRTEKGIWETEQPLENMIMGSQVQMNQGLWVHECFPI